MTLLSFIYTRWTISSILERLYHIMSEIKIDRKVSLEIPERRELITDNYNAERWFHQVRTAREFSVAS